MDDVSAYFIAVTLMWLLIATLAAGIITAFVGFVAVTDAALFESEEGAERWSRRLKYELVALTISIPSLTTMHKFWMW